MTNHTEKTLRALEFATKAHAGQFRKWGSQDPYITHPIRVFERVSNFTSDEDVLCAALLHDVVEDCGVLLKEITNNFGVLTSVLVMELTNPSKNFPELSRKERKAMDREHIAEAMSEAQLIKIVDRIDNLKSMGGSPPDFKKLYAKESLLLEEVLRVPKELSDELIEVAQSYL